MKFGILAPYQLAPIETGEYASEFGRLVEELGFESVWAVEHAVMCVDYESTYPYDPSGRSPFAAQAIQPDPLIWLSYVAAHTRSIRLGTGILILPQHNPVVVAKSVASLDRLSGGRVLLGVGVGWTREEALAVATMSAIRLMGMPRLARRCSSTSTCTSSVSPPTILAAATPGRDSRSFFTTCSARYRSWI